MQTMRSPVDQAKSEEDAGGLPKMQQPILGQGQKIKKVRRGYVYGAISNSGAIKVGFSNNPRQRLSNLLSTSNNTSCPSDITGLHLIGCIESTQDHEREFHSLHRSERIPQTSEWYLSGSDAHLEFLECLRRDMMPDIRAVPRPDIWCPGCDGLSSVQHLRDSPSCARAVASMCGQYRLSKRVTPPTKAGGRPKGSKNKRTTGADREKINLAKG